ncbi:MAG: ATP-binding protein, partial [Candidatus Kapabacteria bacterium]|nr:ATP-binding protein [Candidatus Kapabacteria bacterium]
NRLQQVVWNLLANAVKFTPKQGKIDVIVQRVNSHVEITIMMSRKLLISSPSLGDNMSRQ